MSYRPAREDDRDQVIALMRHAFNQPQWMVDRARDWPLDPFRVHEADGEILATTAIRRFGHFFGGRSIPCAGISAVTVAAHARGKGLAQEHVALAMREAREEFPISALWPATVPLYRRLGYEYGAQRFQYKAPIRELPRAVGDVERWDDKELHDVASAYRDFARQHNGFMDRSEEWWRLRILPVFADVPVHRFLVREDGQVTGSVVFTQENPFHFDIECRDFFALTPAALSGLLGFFARYASMGRNLLWYGPPAEPAGLLLAEQEFEVAERGHLMVRLLDVPGAIAARGFPDHVSESVTIAVQDALFAENQGPWRVAVEGGTGIAEPSRDAAVQASAGALASIFTGFVTPSEARRAGILAADDAAVASLGRIFAGPAPWTADFF